MPISRSDALCCAIAVFVSPLALAATVLPQALPAGDAAPVARAVAANPANPRFAAWADQFAADWVRIDPQMATRAQYFSAAEQAALDRQLTPLTPAQQAKEAAMRSAGLAQLKKWTAGPLGDYGIGAQQVERYVVWPGQACGYMIGMLRIVELREHARAVLGPKFSLPAFNDLVLRAGSVPLDVLAQVVDQWIAAGARDAAI